MKNDHQPKNFVENLRNQKWTKPPLRAKLYNKQDKKTMII